MVTKVSNISSDEGTTGLCDSKISISFFSDSIDPDLEPEFVAFLPSIQKHLLLGT